MSTTIVVPTATAPVPARGDASFGILKDDICQAFGFDGDPRKLLLAGRFLRDVIDDLNRKQLWDFNLVSTTITTAAGTPSYAIPADFWKTYNARRDQDADFQLTTLRQKTFDTIFISQRSINGIPYILVIKNTFRLGTVTLFPTPDGIYTIPINYYKLISKPGADSDVLDLPLPFQGVPKYGAMARMAAVANQMEQVKYYEAKFEMGYREMSRSDEDIGDEDLRFINIEEVQARESYMNPAVRPRVFDLF